MALSSIWKNVFSPFQLWYFSVTQFQWWVQPLWPCTLPQLTLGPPPGYQPIAKISQHGKLLLLFSSWLCLSFTPLTDLPKGSPKMLEQAATAKGAFQGA
jgi:hypothetical protein